MAGRIRLWLDDRRGTLELVAVGLFGGLVYAGCRALGIGS